jgi:predicted TIM-barrel fold metal-dependent hydrolase
MNTTLHSSSTDRRRFLATSFGTAGGVLGAGLLSNCASTGGTKRGFIDAHVHLWTPDTKAYPLAEGFTVTKDMVPASFTPEELFAQCRPEGVDRVVLIQMSFYKYDNRYMLDMIERHDDVFSGVAIVDENGPDVCRTMKSLAGKDVRGFRVYASRAQAEAWGDGMDKMWSCAADHGLAICLLADPGSLPIVHKMCARYPRTRVVIDHFARIGMKGPVQQADLDNLCRLAEFPHTHVKTSAFYALGRKQAPYTDMAPLIRTLRDTFGARRLMWASDCPFQLQGGHTYADSIALIRDRLDFLTAADREWMLRKTAEKVFFS